MRSHAKASTAGSTKRQASGLGRIFRGAAASLLAMSGIEGTGAPSRRRLGLLSVAAAAALLAILPGGAVALSNGRAYEQVSPVDKEGFDVDNAPGMAAIDGNRLLFLSRGSFAGQPTTMAAEASPFLSTRSPDGWTTEGIALPNAQLAFGWAGYQGFNPDMSKGVINWWDISRFGPYDPAAQHGWNQYMRNSETGSFELLNGTLSATQNGQGFNWGTPDFGVLALSTSYPLTADSPCTEPSEGLKCAYEWDHGTLRLASVLPNGEPVKGSVGFQPPGPLEVCSFEHALSDDSSRLFFTRMTSNQEQGAQQLYARENAATTSLVSGSERTLPGGATGFRAMYQAAEAAHGNRVLFTTQNSLVDADEDETIDLYIYDFTRPAGERLTLLSEDQNSEAPQGAAVNAYSYSGTPCGGVAAASEDLRRVYFVADNQILPGEPTAPGPKLYLWDDTGASPQLTYIATLESSDGLDWVAPAVNFQSILRKSRWSRDGRYLAFISAASLTASDTNGEADIYRYDAVSESLDCASCSSDAFPAGGAVTFGSPRTNIRPVNHMSVNVTDDGHVFFQTTRGLVAGDSNGKSDVYDYDGQLELISKGTGDTSSIFLDATPTGSDVFFVTGDRLVGWDVDENRDVYDARVGGGLPEPGFVPPECEGEACLASPVVPNDPTPASATFKGAGNQAVARGRACGRAARRALRLRHAAVRLRRAAKHASSTRRAKRVRRRSVHLARRGRALSKRAQRCRRANRRAHR